MTPIIHSVDRIRRHSYRSEYDTPTHQVRAQQSPYQPVGRQQGLLDKGSPSFQYNLAPNRTDATNHVATASSIPYHENVVLDNELVVMNDYDLNSISQMFFDQHYIEMDRVINYDDGMFSTMGYGDVI